MAKVKFRALPAEGGKVEHRWTIVADNGKIIGAATQGYSRRIDAVTNLAQLAAAIMEWANHDSYAQLVTRPPEQGSAEQEGKPSLRADWVHPGREE